MGGILGAFKKSIEDDYAHLEDYPYGRFAKKEPLLMEQLEGNTAASYTFTNNCIQDVNPFVTQTVFKLLLLTEKTMSPSTSNFILKTQRRAVSMP